MKLQYMLKYLIPLFFLIVLIPSCTDDNMPFVIGDDQVDVHSDIGMIDTFTVRSYTVMLDSIPTSSTTTAAIVVGNITDPYFGTVSASSFFRVTRPAGSGNFNIQDDAVFDSIRVFFIYNKYYEGDTTLPFTVNLHRLNSELKHNDDGFFYNNDSIGAFPEPIGRKTFRPSPNSGDTVWITIDRSIGEDLFEKMRTDDENVNQNDLFQIYFKGFMLRGDVNNNAVIGFNFGNASANAGMRLHYHYTDFVRVYKHLTFMADYSIGNGAFERMQFNRFTLDHPKIQLPKNQSEKLPVSLTDNRSYILAGLGVVTRIEIPYIRSLLFVNSDIRILDARLEIEPVSGTYTEETLPPLIAIRSTGNSNNWGTLIYNKTGKQSTANLEVDVINQENTRYTFDITNFLSSRLEMQTDVIPAIMLHVSSADPISDDFYKTTKRLVLGSQHHRENKIKLKVYYLNVH